MKEAKRFSRIALRVWKKRRRKKEKERRERKKTEKKRRRRKKEKERWKERRGRDIRTKLLNKTTQQNYSFANKITQNYSTNETVLCNSTEQN
jgi:hypothetical protein